LSFRQEQPGQVIFAKVEIAPYRSQLITLNRMRPRVRAFQSFDPQHSSVKAHVFNSQVNGLTTAQAVSVHHQKEEMISHPLATGLGSFEERLHLRRIKKILPSMKIGNVTLHITGNGEVAH
jgi:hypothetical protein